MTGRRSILARRFWAAVFIAPVAALWGCDNAVVNVTDTGWKALAADTTQLASTGKYSTLSIAEGAGPVVNAGDLVKLRIGGLWRSENGADVTRVAWYWTGHLPADYYHYGATQPTILGAMLVGRRAGDRFSVEPGVQEQVADYIQLSGMPEPGQNRKGLGHMEAFRDSSVDWDLFALRKMTVEVVATCPMKLSVRTEQMTQWGYILNMFGTHFPNDRSGTLYWSAIEATCPPPDGPVRFMIGPIYFSATSGPGQEAYRSQTLYNFHDSYRSARPPSKFPREYQHVVIGDKWIHREERNQHWVDVASPAR